MINSNDHSSDGSPLSGSLRKKTLAGETGSGSAKATKQIIRKICVERDAPDTRGCNPLGTRKTKAPKTASAESRRSGELWTVCWPNNTPAALTARIAVG